MLLNLVIDGFPVLVARVHIELYVDVPTVLETFAPLCYKYIT